MRIKDLATRTLELSLPVVVVLLLVFCTVTYAGDSNPNDKKPLEAWQKALLYSKDHPVIAFAVYGRTNDASAQEIGEKIINVFADYQIQSRYYLAKEDRIGSSVGFYLQGVPYGPVALNAAVPLIKKVAQHYQETYSGNP